MICFFLRAHHGLVSLLTAADDAIGHIEDLQLHPLDLDRRNPLARAELRIASSTLCEWISALYFFRIVRVTRSRSSVCPVQLEVPGHGIHEAFLTLEHLEAGR